MVQAKREPLPEFADGVDEEAERLLRIAAWLPAVASGLSGETGITVRTLLAAFLFAEDAISRWFQEHSRGAVALRILGREIDDGQRSELSARVAGGSLPPVDPSFSLFSPSARTLMRKARWLARRVSREPLTTAVGPRHIFGCYALFPDQHAFLEGKLPEAFATFVLAEDNIEVLKAGGSPLIAADDREAWKAIASGRLSDTDRALLAAIDKGDANAAFEVGKRMNPADDPTRTLTAFLTARDLGHPDAQAALDGLPATAPAETGTPATTATTAPSDLIANLGNDDPDAPEITDQLRVEDEAHAFARLAASKALSPPLAVGVFGEWGSGKSFFMRLIREHVFALTEFSKAKGESSRYLSEIVQIRFNAWHYMESNLWASLVDYIFTELDRWITERTDGAGNTNEFMNRLATARHLTLEAAEALVERRKEQEDAAGRLAEAERALNQARAAATLSPRDVANAFAEVFKGEIDAFKAKGNGALEATGLSALESDAQGFKSALDELTDERRRGAVLAGQMVQQLGSPWNATIVIGLVAVLPAGLAAATAFVASTTDSSWLNGISTLAVPVAGFFAGATGAVRTLLNQVRPHLDRLTELKASLDKAFQAKLADEEDKRTAAAADLAEKTAATERARSALQAATAAVAAAIEAYAADTGSRRLRRFVRERASDGTYAKHLGLIATVRRDFEQLSRLMLNKEPSEDGEALRLLYEKQVEDLIARAGDALSADEQEHLRDSARSLRDTAAFNDAKFERIILYIDDLDRCPPAKVVDVLQAIHLLLHFRLFVVVVAVDARWVARSLKDVYPDLLAETVIRPGTGEHGERREPPRTGGGEMPARRANTSADGERAASSQDYLEKIFQIPYWVRRMTAEASRDYIASVAIRKSELSEEAPALTAQPTAAALGDATSSEPAPQPVAHTAFEPAAADTGTDAAAAGSSSEARRSSKARETAAGRPSAKTTAAQRVLHERASALEEKAAEFLEQGDVEIAFMRELAPFVGGTPRRGLRFVNVYRLIKTGLEPTIRDALVGDDGRALGYRALLTQVAIATGSPRSALAYFDTLAAAGPQAGSLKADSDVAALITFCEAELPDDIDKPTLVGALRTLEVANRRDKISVGNDLYRQLKDFAPIAGRYAFTARHH